MAGAPCYGVRNLDVIRALTTNRKLLTSRFNHTTQYSSICFTVFLTKIGKFSHCCLIQTAALALARSNNNQRY